MGYSSDVNAPEFWEEIYRAGDAHWDVGGPTPVFARLAETEPWLVPGAMLVFGAGRGHDAVAFARRGFDVTAVDFAPSAIAAIQESAHEAGVRLQAIEADLFDLSDRFHEHFDYVLEYTCFCAIDPSRRAEYLRLVAGVLRPGGRLLALLFPSEPREGGPPFRVTLGDLISNLPPDLTLARSEEPADSIKPRMGRETLAIVSKSRSPEA
jgi:SAM-dependent methyltransferase